MQLKLLELRTKKQIFIENNFKKRLITKFVTNILSPCPLVLIRPHRSSCNLATNFLLQHNLCHVVGGKHKNMDLGFMVIDISVNKLYKSLKYVDNPYEI